MKNMFDEFMLWFISICLIIVFIVLPTNLILNQISCSRWETQVIENYNIVSIEKTASINWWFVLWFWSINWSMKYYFYKDIWWWQYKLESSDAENTILKENNNENPSVKVIWNKCWGTQTIITVPIWTIKKQFNL